MQAVAVDEYPQLLDWRLQNEHTLPVENIDKFDTLPDTKQETLLAVHTYLEEHDPTYDDDQFVEHANEFARLNRALVGRFHYTSKIDLRRRRKEGEKRVQYDAARDSFEVTYLKRAVSLTGDDGEEKFYNEPASAEFLDFHELSSVFAADHGERETAYWSPALDRVIALYNEGGEAERKAIRLLVQFMALKEQGIDIPKKLRDELRNVRRAVSKLGWKLDVCALT